MPKKFSQREIELSNQIVQFLRKDLIFSINSVEKILDLPATTLAKCVNEKTNAIIPSKHLFPLISFLSGYGLMIDDCKILKNEDHEGNLTLFFYSIYYLVPSDKKDKLLINSIPQYSASSLEDLL